MRDVVAFLALTLAWLAVFVAISVRILRDRAILSWRQLFCWALSGIVAAALAIRELVT